MSFAPPNIHKAPKYKVIKEKLVNDSKSPEAKLQMLERSVFESSTDKNEFLSLLSLIPQVPKLREAESFLLKSIEDYQNLEKEIEDQANFLNKLVKSTETIESDAISIQIEDHTKFEAEIEDFKDKMLLLPLERNIGVKKQQIALKEGIIETLALLTTELATYKTEIEEQYKEYQAQIEQIIPELLYEEALIQLEKDADWIKEELFKVIEHSVEELNAEFEIKQFRLRQKMQQEILALKSLMQAIRLETRFPDYLLLNDDISIEEKHAKLSERTNQDIMNVLGYVISGLEILEDSINSAVEFNETFQEKLKESITQNITFDEETKSNLRVEIGEVQNNVEEAKNSHETLKSNSEKNFGKIKETVGVIETLQRQMMRSGNNKSEDFRGKTNIAENKVNEKMNEMGNALKMVEGQLYVSRQMLETNSIQNFQTNLLSDSNSFVVSFKEPPPFRNVQPGTTPLDSPEEPDEPDDSFF